MTADPYAGTDKSGQPSATLADVHRLYRRWLGPDYDIDALTCVLAVAAAERLGGDPPWLLVVGGPGAAKTETIVALAGAGSDAHLVSTINGEAALLSGTSKKERSKTATGGLLRAVGSRGTIVIKDVTSILSMNRDTRALVLAALREIYDGAWSRNVGTDGGQTITWTGRLVIIGAVTTAWDAAHTVIATMGDRFLLVRLDSSESRSRRAAGRQAMQNVSHETQMRKELSATVGDLLGTVTSARGLNLTEDEIEGVLAIADLVTAARTAVERDFSGDPMFAHEPEMPTRMAKQLVQVARGATALGVERTEALRLARRCARDSLPPIRLRVLLDVSKHPESTVSEVSRRIQLPRKTVDRTMRELHLLGLLEVRERPFGQTTQWLYLLATTDSVEALEGLRLARNVSTPGDPTAVGQECQ